MSSSGMCGKGDLEQEGMTGRTLTSGRCGEWNPDAKAASAGGLCGGAGL